jgi:DNA-binding CsgD family transcriptional regulator
VEIMAQLTQREREIVLLLMQGKQPRDIRQDLCIERSTMREHLRHARDKAGARTTIELVAKVAKEIE